MQNFFKNYQVLFEDHFKNFIVEKTPKNLYDPIRYLLQIKGKRVRPILTLLTTDIFGSNPKASLDAALSVEIFHNFTLVHDDIMDEAALRRGAVTVHKKWDLNTAILSGDAMLIQAYKILENYSDSLFKKLFHLLNKTSAEVCEGQQYDLDFEKKNKFNINNYIKMTRLKTAVLIGCCLKMGAIIGGATQEDSDLLYNFGIETGIAFQLQDDYLDSFGNPKDFGKKIGGDILRNKKTILYHMILKKGNLEHQEKIKKILSLTQQNLNAEEKINQAKNIYIESGAKDGAREMINFYSNSAEEKIKLLAVSNEKKKIFINLVRWLMKREK